MDNTRFRCCEQAICDSGTCDLATSYRPPGQPGRHSARRAWARAGRLAIGRRQAYRLGAAQSFRLGAAWRFGPGAVWRFGPGAV
jgi:hypothetical protein